MADNSNLSRLFSNAGTQTQQQGTGYTNLNRLFQANQNNQLGQKVTGNLQNQIGQVKSQLGEQQNTFNTEAEKNRVDTDQNKQNRNAVIGRFSDSSGTSNTSGPSESDVNNFQKYLSGSYSGPSGLQDIGTLQSSANELKNQTSSLSPSGTQELLRRTVGGTGGRYTQGQQRLDSLLLDRSSLRPVQREATALTGQIGQADLAAQGKAEQYKNAANAFAQETQGQLKTAMGGLDTAAQQQLDAAQAAENQRLANIQAIQNFAAGKSYNTSFTPEASAVTKTGSNGTKTVTNSSTGDVATYNADGTIKYVTDQYGNTKYNTDVNAVRGSSDVPTQIENLQALLQKQGAQSGELQSLFGNFGQDIANYGTQKQNNYNNIQQQAFADLIGGGSQLDTNLISSNPQEFQNYLRDLGEGEVDRIGIGKALDTQKLAADLGNGTISRNSPLYQDILNKGGLTSLVNANLAPGTSYANKISDLNNPIVQNFRNSSIAAKAYDTGNTENFYKNLAATLANSQNAQNLTKAGVASQPIINNYTALSKLLGTTANPYANGGNYQAGQFLLNPELIKNSL